MRKIVSPQHLIRIVRSLARRGKRIVTVNGSFDLLHPGHIDLLNAARRYGDALVVLLNSDTSVRLYKGPARPYVSAHDRAVLLAALSTVDYVVFFSELTPVTLLAKIRPQVHVNGADWGIGCVEQDTVERYGGKLKIVRLRKSYSSTALVRRICAAEKISSPRAVFLDRDGTINYNDPPYLHRSEDFHFMPYALSALRRLAKSNYKIFIITNQSGIGRGYYRLRDMHLLHRWIIETLRKKGVRIDGIYYCPHRPDAGCRCRKPAVGLVLSAARKYGINLSKSWVVGDGEADVQLGRNANMKTIKVGGRLPRGSKLLPHFYAKNLRDAVSIIHSESI